jgi:hypothetical protein
VLLTLKIGQRVKWLEWEHSIMMIASVAAFFGVCLLVDAKLLFLEFLEHDFIIDARGWKWNG